MSANSLHSASPLGTANNALERELARAQVMTPAGSKYVAMVTNPFSNEPVETIGMPDAVAGASVVYDIKGEIAVTKPATMIAGAWDVHVAFMPHFTDGDEAHCCIVKPGGARVPLTTETAPQYMLMISHVPEGTESFTGRNAAEVIEMISPAVLLDPSTRSRLLGGGVKVTDTTAEVYRQGACTVYATENHASEEFHYDEVATAPLNAVTSRHEVIACAWPPRLIGQAKQLQQKSQAARDGALFVLRRDGIENPAQPPTLADLAYKKNELVGSGWNAYSSKQCPLVDDYDGKYIRTTPFMQQGAYFTGLSEQTSLNVTFRFFVEEFPPPGNERLPLARGSPHADPVALEIADRILSTMPVGSPASHNSWGTFARGLLGAARSIIPQVVRTVVPGGAELMDAVGSAQRAVKSGRAAARKAKARKNRGR